MSEKCSYILKYGKCYYGNKSKKADHAHIGTEEKLEFIGKYTRDWPYKTLLKNDPYDCIVFVDAMCSSGEYLNNQGQTIKGSTLRVLDSFMDASRNPKLRNKKMYLFFNDIDEISIECQLCRIAKNKEPLSNNIVIKDFCLDVKDFLMKRDEYLPIDKNFHVILYYDPYKVEFFWDQIVYFLSKRKPNGKFLKFDLILTHFHQNDTSRVANSKSKIDDSVKKRYEESYGVNYEELISILSKMNPEEKRIELRSRFRATLAKKLFIDETRIVYAPIFNKKNRDVYDIVFYSDSQKALSLFKNTMFNSVSKRSIQKVTHQISLDVFEDIKQMLDFEAEEYNEIEYYYSISSFANIVSRAFIGREINVDELKRFIEVHPFIPCNVFKKIKNCLISDFNVIWDKDLIIFPTSAGGQDE
jgi:three-Cys-motif partner protein